jgi:hypothetical protein
VLPTASKADSFDWTYQGTGTIYNIPLNSGSGELTTTDGVITEVSGTFNGLAITGLLPPGTFAENDNVLLFPAAPLYLTFGGFSFVDSADTQWNIYGSVGTQCQCEGSICICIPYNSYVAINGDQLVFDYGIFTLTPLTTTPEPSIIVMLLAGILAIALVLMGKRVQVKLSSPSTLSY